MPQTDREVLQEVGGPPDLPTKEDFRNFIAKLEPGKLTEAKTQIREMVKRKWPSDQKGNNSTEAVPVDKTHVLEMELLKLKGQVHKNKNTMMHLIKKLSSEGEMVKESIRDLATTRSEELNLIEAVKRDNFELQQKKNQLELDLIDQSERMEQMMASLAVTQRSIREREQKMQSLESENFELNKQIETLELKINLSSRCDQQVTFAASPPVIVPREVNNGDFLPDWGSLHNYLMISLIIFIVAAYFIYQGAIFPETAPCEDCDYERDIYTRIHI